MSKLWVHPDSDPSRVLRAEDEPGAIADVLKSRGVRFEQWSAPHALEDGAGQEAVLAAYHEPVEQLKREGPYPKVDVVRMKRDPGDAAWTEKARAARQKFLEEHTHAEDEVRFFVEGSGIFYLRIDGLVHVVLCERGDLISVPAGTLHWFDMGTDPHFCAIRFFGTPEGWVASFTGDPIAQRFPTFDALARGAQ